MVLKLPYADARSKDRDRPWDGSNHRLVANLQHHNLFGLGTANPRHTRPMQIGRVSITDLAGATNVFPFVKDNRN